MDIQSELKRFDLNMRELLQEGRAKLICEDAFLIKSSEASKLYPNKGIDLTIMGLTHGNEVGGLSVVNSLIEKIWNRSLEIPFRLAICLGNRAAALQNERFLEKDLNRCFGSVGQESLEEKRAHVLASHILSHTHFMLDLHQTSAPCVDAFFIFPYTLSGYRFARSLHKDLPLITHWSGGFSKDGRCSDEYTNSCGGVGISVELGQNAFAGPHVQIGHDIVTTLIQKLIHSQIDTNQPLTSQETDQNIWTWAHVESYPKGQVELIPGLMNLGLVQKNQMIARVVNEDKSFELLSPVDGPVLFPKYKVSPGKAAPAELIRYLRKIEIRDLPHN